MQIELPRVEKNNIIQCRRRQQYGHIKSYCNKPIMCVKCGGSHNSKECNKSKDTPAKCALCGGNRRANYKGCEHYRNLIKGNSTFRNDKQHTAPVNTNIHTT